MTDAYQDRLEEAERAQEEAEGRLTVVLADMAERVLRRLTARGLAVTDAQRAQVTGCTEPGRLLDWLEAGVVGRHGRRRALPLREKVAVPDTGLV